MNDVPDGCVWKAVHLWSGDRPKRIEEILLLPLLSSQVSCDDCHDVAVLNAGARNLKVGCCY